ncbi:septum formation inhibitor Maf [Hazenella sp. IB182357]|uniref:dTTP/UTP pyrophosphatase n=2 Tax=Polycladospora coralii TaxID=2771432 RepID=A0A926N5H2_9BACL|nr:Maf family protein [Polycladospora coralii]MBD1371779.1 septum formation inhibitor Maf [Polycladospora coralii]MBS7529240.1 septum formation inhibitor Maf [Polycladospora coralii]
MVLASGSPRRKELLNNIGLMFRVQTSEIDEHIDAHASPQDNVMKLALQKATAVANSCDDAIVIGADTVVVLEGQILGKPSDTKEAVEMLQSLQGRVHEVFTGIALVEVRAGNIYRTQERARCTRVWMKPLDRDRMEWYVGTGDPMDKAGAYGIQGIGSILVDQIEGCFFNVMGLSVSLIDEMFKNWGIQVGTKIRSQGV